MADVKETLLTAEGLKKLEEELMAISVKTLNMMMQKMNKLSSKVIL